MKELTQEELDNIELAESRAKSLGLKTMVREIAEENYTLYEQLYIKFNIPESEEKFKSGNGEGVWAQPLTEEDKEICDSNSTGDTFKVIILNSALTFPFDWGTVVTVETRGDSRPVLSYDWFDGVVKESTNGEMSLAEMLED